MRLLAVPTRRELKPLAKELRLVPLETSPFPTFYTEEVPSSHIILSGLGMVQTAISLTFALNRSQYSKVILTGVAGIHPESNLKPGGLVGSSSETYLRLGSLDGEYMDLTKKFTLDPTSEIRSCFETKVSDYLKDEIPWVPFGTSDWITASTEDLCFLKTFHPQIIVENMEGASAAHVCRKIGRAHV